MRDADLIPMGDVPRSLTKGAELIPTAGALPIHRRTLTKAVGLIRTDVPRVHEEVNRRPWS